MEEEKAAFSGAVGEEIVSRIVPISKWDALAPAVFYDQGYNSLLPETPNTRFYRNHNIGASVLLKDMKWKGRLLTALAGLF